MWLEHEIASVYRSLLFEVKSFLRKTLIKEFLEPKINTLELRGGSSKVFLGGRWVSSRVFLYNSLGDGGRAFK